MEGTQWGKAGPGGAYWRNSALTGQGFFDKMVGVNLKKRFKEQDKISGMEWLSRSKEATV